MDGSFKEINYYPVELQFNILSPEEIKKMSVVEVVSSLTFDQLGRPLPGGLYDPLMGSYGRCLDPCSTCLNTISCPGHIGHIKLNAVMNNPFFTNTVYSILKMSCLKCFRLQISSWDLNVIMLQLRLVDAGYITEAQELDFLKTGFSKEGRINSDNNNENRHKLDEMVALLQKRPRNINCTKTSNAIRSSILHTTLQICVPTKCIHCKQLFRRVKMSYKKLVIIITKEEMKQLSNSETEVSTTKVILSDECRDYLREIYKLYGSALKELFPILKFSPENINCPTDLFFMEIIPVTPPKTRPTNVLQGDIVEHPQTILYKNIIEANCVLRVIFGTAKTGTENTNEEAKNTYELAKGASSHEKVYYAWESLQENVDQLLDANVGSVKSSTQGLKQLLEKKEGLIRKHMMGKRVNFAARTVITPDPNINVEEVGVPDIFAKRLSYPVPVTSWNVSKLRKLILNGPDIHPGANYIEDERGFKTIIPANDPSKRESYSKLLLTNTGNGVKIVHRHLLNGDVLLLNRQPTLHKPSIMAHKARILKNEKTFRLHYSNCKSYNADFDGDEMNAHFPQSENARSEAYHIANVENQYLVPKDGTPLGGLIQDHVISGVKLSIRGRFFNREDYQQLVFQGLSHIRGNIIFLPPTIIKPKKLWSGKQILSTIIINLIPEDYPAINLTSVAKVSPNTWRTQKSHTYISGGSQLRYNEMSESEVIIRNGELLLGVLDKQQYGATQYGLVHCMYELYGGTCSTRLLTSFTKLFTNFLQREGFTLGVHDILVSTEADEKRKKIIKECRNIGISITAEALDLEDATVPTIALELEKAYINNPKYRLVLDRHYKTVLDKYTNEINKVCLPTGLISQFPLNNLQLMVLSGAKGSMVNTMQISCLLGQIELEGKRPPLMISGKSLPSFASFETSPKSGGFIDGRFMTGIQPQEFFFHCMAGREGLIDTAVKTSRSGYLQRCLIKHLEGLTVNYDLTVRDSDNTVVQFMYGEDGMDISKSRFFNEKCLSFLDENSDVILHVSELDKIKNENDLEMVRKIRKKIKSWKKHHGDPKKLGRLSSFQKYSAEIRNEVEVANPTLLNSLTGRLNVNEQIIALWINANPEMKNKYKKKYSKCPDPIVANLKPDNIYGAINENIDDLMNSYIEKQPNRKSEISDIIYVKSIKSMAAPGESVGLLAAQSVGEPSTQMTLNTFHFAGRGEMNVTLGIPRLREILMLASSNIKTPSMDIPFLPVQLKTSDKLRIKLNQVTIADTLQHIKIENRLICDVNRWNQYTITFTFLPRESYQDDLSVKPKQIIKYMSEVFFKTMFKAIGRASRGKSAIIDINDKKQDDQQKDNEDDDGEGNNDGPTKKVPVTEENGDSSSEENEDDGTTSIRLKSKKQDETEYDDLEDDEEVKEILGEQDKDLDEEALDQLEELCEAKKDDMLETVMTNDAVNEYDYDKDNYLWCKITFNLPLRYKKVDMSNILKQLCEKSVVHSVDKIKRAITYMKNDVMVLKTDGINIKEMFKYNKLLDLNRLYCNDIHAIAGTYGIEAAARVIVKEVQTVFGVYGITVDPRHLLLIADYMTFDGTFKPLSRKGMEHSASPLQQMSFESCLQFLKSAIVNGRHDDLNSPSSRLMVGLPGKCGTGSFSLLAPFS